MVGVERFAMNFGMSMKSLLARWRKPVEDETGHQTYIPNPEDPEGPLTIVDDGVKQFDGALRDLAYKIYDKVMQMENGEGGCSLYDYCIDPNAENGFDESRVDSLLQPIIDILTPVVNWEKL